MCIGKDGITLSIAVELDVVDMVSCQDNTSRFWLPLRRCSGRWRRRGDPGEYSAHRQAPQAAPGTPRLGVEVLSAFMKLVESQGVFFKIFIKSGIVMLFTAISGVF